MQMYDTLAAITLVGIATAFPALWYWALGRAKLTPHWRTTLSLALGTGTFYAILWIVLSLYLESGVSTP